jgi:hypothetical protein
MPRFVLYDLLNWSAGYFFQGKRHSKSKNKTKNTAKTKPVIASMNNGDMVKPQPINGVCGLLINIACSSWIVIGQVKQYILGIYL